ncbi:hypothetical protein CA51_02080 [Rosistilla oblonga]|uniref:outer membrane beta-barrel protein n=1 Tax=Rosistilla oblonga TaxID=2527990 RepID=UPI00118AE1DD|nr:outer membrane beta-barrel protein [Rosistilla oblonga]QDV10360.1 hypothetical protein CA51_02080 [Rosistilla oblonga]
MNLISRFFAIACICNAGLAVGQQFGHEEYPSESYPISGEGYKYQGDGGYYGNASCESCGPAPAKSCFASCLDGFTYGGWAQLGYYTYGSPMRFNDHPDRVNLSQMWLFAGKQANGAHGLDLGGRIDYVYGVDAQDTQAFGVDNGSWDTGWDNGIYGSAMPQLYGEAAYGNTSIKMGHFFTLIGYEVVSAPDNFFFSHSYTMVNSEPFTHTGALVTHKANEFVTVWGGYTLGWDSGYTDNGDNFLGGISVVLTDYTTITYTNTIGRLNENLELRGQDMKERGQMHSIVASTTVENFNHVLQIDRLDTKNQFDTFARDTFGINNYLFYDLADDVAAGLRFEWWNNRRDTNDHTDVYALTLGLNLKPKEFITVRPEVRWDWDVDAVPLGINEPNPNSPTNSPRSNQTTFGIDAIVTF